MIPPQYYITLSLKNLGFDTFQTNLLTIPYYVGHSKLLSFVFSFRYKHPSRPQTAKLMDVSKSSPCSG